MVAVLWRQKSRREPQARAVPTCHIPREVAHNNHAVHGRPTSGPVQWHIWLGVGAITVVLAMLLSSLEEWIVTGGSVDGDDGNFFFCFHVNQTRGVKAAPS